MSDKKTEKKKKARIKKGHIWPSIVFLILSLFLTVAGFTVAVSFIMTYFVNDRLLMGCSEANMMKEIVLGKGGELYGDDISVSMGVADEDTSLVSEEQPSEEEYFSLAVISGSYSDALVILDRDYNPLESYGDITYDLSKMTEYNADEDSPYCGLAFCQDKNAEVYSIKDSGINVKTDTLIQYFKTQGRRLFAGVDLASCLGPDKSIVWDDYYWVFTPLPDGKVLATRLHLFLYNGDFLLALVAGMILLVVMAFPVVFLFLNLISAHKNQHRTVDLLYTDNVTQGNSWAYYEQHASQTLEKISGRDLYAVVDICPTKFRNFLACNGAKAGDELLEQIDRALSLHMKKKIEYCGHFGKASFALLLKCEDMDSAKSRIQDILGELTETLGKGSMCFHAGVYFVQAGELLTQGRARKRQQVDVAEFYNRASAARSVLPDENQTALAVFDEHVLEDRRWEQHVESRLQSALEQEEFQVYLQPKYNPVTEKLVGAEALIRWISEEEGFVPPGRFIPILEKNGSITQIDDYMISHVAKLQAQWLAQGKAVVPVSVNVSRAHFADPKLAEHICELVDAHKVPHKYVEIELTESAFFDDKRALLGTVKKLQDMGFDVSMDDFGSGYSSLNSLKDLPLNVLKLDADFFRGEGEERGELVVSQAIKLAKKLNMRVVAEGVEKKEQVDFLAAQNCDMIQGYYFAKPMPAADYEKKLS